MLNYEIYDEEISKRLQPVRDELAKANINVAAIPQQAQQLSQEAFQSVDWLFSGLEGLPREGNQNFQKINVQLAVRLTFDNRFIEDEATHSAALEWAEVQILKLLCLWKMTNTTTVIELQNARLFAPEAGLWYKELKFQFQAYLYPRTEIDPISDNLVKNIEIKSCNTGGVPIETMVGI